MKLTGYAAVFNTLSVDLGDFRETVAPGAFRRTLADGHPIFAVHHHDMADLLGSTRSGSLKLREDAYGLYFELALPDTALGRDVHELVKRGDLAAMSFSFRVNGTRGEDWTQTGKGQIRRTLKDVTLLEISTVALPAYMATSVQARMAPTPPVPPAGAQVPPAHDTRAMVNRMRRTLMAARLRAA